MGFADWLSGLDRRWLFLIMGLLVLFPVLFPLSLPLHVTPPVNAFPRDCRGHDAHGLPVMRRVRGYTSFPLLVNISSGYPGTKEWVQQVQARFHLPMVAGVTAVSAPEYYPYLQSGQLRGMLGGMAGAAEYEKARGERGSATRGMDAQSLGHLLVAFCIVLGNVVRRRPPEARA